MARLTLPTEERQLVEALDHELIASEQEANLNLVSWKIVDSYLAGARRFRVLDRWRGDLSLAFENNKGDLDLRYEELVGAYLVECGRYMKMDVSPMAEKPRDSLDGLRKAAIATAALAGLTRKVPLDRIKRQMIIPFLKYGTVGLAHYETGIAFSPDMMEVVPPRQLRGLPAWVDGMENSYAIGRKRWVPMTWLQDRMKKVHNKRVDRWDPVKDLRAEDIPWGGTPPGHSNFEANQPRVGSTFTVDTGDLMGLNLRKGRRKSPQNATGRFFVPLEEVYVYDETQQFVARYIVKVGEKILIDEDFEAKGLHIVCPLHVARHTDTGRFFSRGFVGPLIPFNDQIEKMLANLFRNIQELDMFGTLMVSGSMGVDLKRWRTGPRPKVEKYEPDPINPTAQPFKLEPSNSGLLPARVAEFTMNLMPRLTRQGPYYSGETSGRVDSAAGLGFLFNTGNMSLGLPANGLADAFVGVYGRMLQSAQERLGPGDTIELALIDDAIAGVVINPQTGVMELSRNPLPNPWDIKLNVKDRTPRDPDVRKRELLELYGQQLVDYERFWITAFEDNLDFPGAPKEIWETWRKAVWQIILLFNDGRTPGPLIFGEHTQMPEIQLRALVRFMNKIEFSLADKAVRTAFEEWKMGLEGLAGMQSPVGLPAPEDAAVMQQQVMAGQMAPPGGPGGLIGGA